jgi:hypothetical protein
MNNTPAFPNPHLRGDEGMTLRDYFAAKAMQGMLAESGGGALHNTNLSEFAYLIADAMLKAREA